MQYNLIFFEDAAADASSASAAKIYSRICLNSGIPEVDNYGNSGKEEFRKIINIVFAFHEEFWNHLNFFSAFIIFKLFNRYKIHKCSISNGWIDPIKNHDPFLLFCLAGWKASWRKGLKSFYFIKSYNIYNNDISMTMTFNGRGPQNIKS